MASFSRGDDDGEEEDNVAYVGACEVACAAWERSGCLEGTRAEEEEGGHHLGRDSTSGIGADA